ncbi:PepSY domain-containing protein [Desulfosarcina ovata]|uniref:Peptidase n=1 Tax=Desulfosarcina ovata subsp. ovata TaxID=2752305 RepID=A0A5K8AAM7_9BACT|nr:PepSY domain-containing protein [Desulfosarcina ovata]BBO89647.1 peptidase [Desulfosarcina ovata subsp. ovata]
MLRKAHKILGLTTGPLMILWFLSGIVMMYVDHPRFHRTSRDRLPRTAPLIADTIAIDFREAWAKTGLSEPPIEARLNMLIDRPAYFFRTKESRRNVVYADDGSILDTISPESAIKSASHYLGKTIDVAEIRSLNGVDQWTVGTATGVWYRPLYKLCCRDEDATWVYVSKTSGEVCQVVTKQERGLVWLGSIPHWLYFTVLRKHLELWRQVIIWLSAIATLAVLLGLWIGVAGFRWKGYGRRRYKRSSLFIGIRKWHHYLGLVFGLTTLLWVFSGMMSLSPFNWHSNTAPKSEETLALSGGDIDPTRFALHPAKALNTSQAHDIVRQMDLLYFRGTTYYRCWTSPSESFLIRADASGHSPIACFSLEDILAASQGLVTGHQPIDHRILTTYDRYYVDKKRQLRLPVVRLTFDDPAHTLFYIDMHDGTIARRYDASARLNRWLYRFPHCLDIPFLLRHRLMRDGLMLFFLSGGAGLVITGLYSPISDQ